MAFNQAVEVFRQIRGMVPGALQSLGHQENLESGGVALGNSFREVFLKQGVTDAVDIFIHLQDLAGAFEIESRVAGMNQVEHVPQNRRHLDQLADIGGGDFSGPRLYAQRGTHDQITDPLQVGGGLQAGQQLPGAGLIDAGDGGGQAFVDLAFQQVEFFLAILDGKERHARRVGEQVAKIECGIAGNQAGPQHEIAEVPWITCLGTARFRGRRVAGLRSIAWTFLRLGFARR